MFGYITVNKPELKFKEFDVYRSYYCGLCRALKDRYGKVGQMTLTFDCTFLVILLSSLYEVETDTFKFRCGAHPLVKQQASVNEISRYAADIEVILAYFQCLDDWKDEKKGTKAVMSIALKNSFKKAAKRHPDKTRAIIKGLKAIRRCELENNTDIDTASGLFGDILSEIFDYKHDFWSESLRNMGFYLGKFIYLMDAYEDLEKDKKSGNYNPLLQIYEKEEWMNTCEQLLTLIMSECCRYFERLPIIDNAVILRNILYSGVWLKFDIVNSKRKVQ